MSKKLIYVFIAICLLGIPAFLINAGTPKAVQEELDTCKAERANLESENAKLKSDRDSLNAKITKLEGEKSELERKISNLEKQIAQKEEEVVAKEEEARDLMIVSTTVEEKVKEKEAEIAELMTAKKEKEAEITRLRMEKQDLELEKETLISDKEELRADLRQANIELTHLKSEKERLEKENQELETALAEYEKIQRKSQAMMDIALKKIHEALREEIETGKVRVFKGSIGIVLDVTGEYMFDTGKVEINPGGKIILGKIAKLLDDLDGYLIGVIGNADSKPIVTPALRKRFGTNWELSAHRGAVIVRYLIDNSNISPRRLVAMGLGKYQPIDSNVTETGRGNNRRVDIVLLPIDVLAAVVVGAEIK